MAPLSPFKLAFGRLCHIFTGFLSETQPHPLTAPTASTCSPPTGSTEENRGATEGNDFQIQPLAIPQKVRTLLSTQSAMELGSGDSFPRRKYQPTTDDKAIFLAEQMHKNETSKRE